MSSLFVVKCKMRCIYLQVVAPDQRHELLSRMSLLKLALYILLDKQAGVMVSVDRFRAAGMHMMLSAQMDFEPPGFGYVPLPGAKIYMMLLCLLNAVVSMELLTEIASAVPWDDAGRVSLSPLLIFPFRIQEISQ